VIGAITAGLYAGGVPPVTNSYESIATLNGDGTNTFFTFSSIPSTYKHLQVRILARWTDAVTTGGIIMRMNSDSGSNYSYHYVEGDGGSAGAGGGASLSFAYPFGNVPGSSTASNIYSTIVIDILDYANTNKNKTMRALAGYDANGSGLVGLRSSAWYNTAAINSLTFGSSAYKLTTASQIALYGIKG
jgi:hypothetical protein